MGDEFIIQGDGALGPGGVRSQRAWGILNGIESEGWPNLSDWEFEDWSGGMNRHFFWRENARQPAFSYVNHKWNQAVPGKPGERANPDVPFSRHRLVFAACQFFDAATCYSFAPRNDPDGKFGVWDEFRCGTDKELGWLGRSAGPAVRLATRTPDLLSGEGTGAALAERISGQVKTSVTTDGVHVSAVNAERPTLRFVIGRIPTRGPDLFVTVRMHGDPRRQYPREMARFAEFGASGGMVDLMAGEPLATGMKLRGSQQEVLLDASTGASVQRRPGTIDGQTLPTYFVHPPYQGAKGYTFWEQEVDVPRDSELRFSMGMGELSPQRSDGVLFEVQASVVKAGRADPYIKVFEATTNQHRWLPQRVSLQQYSGQRVRLKFVADCGPNNNATTDHAHWGGVKIVAAQAGEDRITESQQFMTWVNDKTFQSGFYYQHVKTETVDLAMTVEGSEPVHIQSVTAHAHPDAVYREFEHGVVLANPSRRPYTFDLQQLSPGRQYRRISATASQDTKTNNGQAVGATVTLGERDALFLKRME